MNVFSVGSSGKWSPPSVISKTEFAAPPWATIVAAPWAGVPDQTDVHVTDQNGQLTVFSCLYRLLRESCFPSVWATTLIGPAVYPDGSGAPFAPSGAAIAVSPQFGVTHRPDVFIVDTHGTLNAFWVEADGPWQGPLALGNAAGGLNVPAGSFMAATAQFGVTGQTDVLMMNSLPTPVPAFPGVGWPVGWPCIFSVEDAG